MVNFFEDGYFSLYSECIFFVSDFGFLQYFDCDWLVGGCVNSSSDFAEGASSDGSS